MRYILFSPRHTQTIPAITKTDGTVIPEREYTVEARALYKHKKLPDRRYRSDIPNFDPSISLVICKTPEEARQEQEALKNYCGEIFEIHSYSKGQIGPIIVITKEKEDPTNA